MPGAPFRSQFALYRRLEYGRPVTLQPGLDSLQRRYACIELAEQLVDFLNDAALFRFWGSQIVKCPI